MIYPRLRVSLNNRGGIKRVYEVGEIRPWRSHRRQSCPNSLRDSPRLCQGPFSYVSNLFTSLLNHCLWKIIENGGKKGIDNFFRLMSRRFFIIVCICEVKVNKRKWESSIILITGTNFPTSDGGKKLWRMFLSYKSIPLISRVSLTEFFSIISISSLAFLNDRSNKKICLHRGGEIIQWLDENVKRIGKKCECEIFRKRGIFISYFYWLVNWYYYWLWVYNIQLTRNARVNKINFLIF